LKDAFQAQNQQIQEKLAGVRKNLLNRNIDQAVALLTLIIMTDKPLD